MKLLKSEYAIAFYVIAAIILFVVMPWSEVEQKAEETSSGYVLALETVSHACVDQLRAPFVEQSIDFPKKSAESYCLCVAAQGLLAAKTEKDAVLISEAWLSNPDILNGFVRLDSIVSQCGHFVFGEN